MTATTGRNHVTEPSMDTAQGQDFAVFVTSLSKGRTNRDLSEALQAVVAAVAETRKVGSVTLKIDIKPQPNTTAVTVTDKVTAKCPEFDRSASIFFVDGDGHLVRDDPNQSNLFQEHTNR